MKKYPWLKFYTSDWLADPGLRMCSSAARGLWIDMVCIMHDAKPYGHLLIAESVPTDAQLSSIVGIPVEELQSLLSELEKSKVFSKKRSSVIYSRKLVRMQEKVVKARKNGIKGGNPKLEKDIEIEEKKDSRLTREVNLGVKPQNPEPRIQKQSEADASAGNASRHSKSVLFDTGVTYLVSKGIDEQRARSFIGKLRKTHSDLEVLASIEACKDKGAVDPIPYIEAILNEKRPEIVKPEIWDRLQHGGSIQ
ncbi:hypothetical protein [Roseovarius aestuarii]|uniref:Phage replisome organiser N-terminal domain-containing protein n=1 Tax=Roseovarius aestuarii TaxID=475083 RepID=A0A1X7BYM4_9RHOB|nr:hypothetical protein [Roseovarius aestuarii]SMC14708.1 hypothetical protein ROA7745_04578 [Roseovarius aestuarii]